MKIEKSASGKMKLVLSHSEWINIGKKAGWGGNTSASAKEAVDGIMATLGSLSEGLEKAKKDIGATSDSYRVFAEIRQKVSDCASILRGYMQSAPKNVSRFVYEYVLGDIVIKIENRLNSIYRDLSSECSNAENPHDCMSKMINVILRDIQFILGRYVGDLRTARTTTERLLSE